MKLPNQVIDRLMVMPGEAARLGRRSTSDVGVEWLGPLGHQHPRDVAVHDLEAFKSELATAQELLYAANRFAILVVIQALDAAGKDGTIKHVMSGVNPQGCEVTAFKQPTTEELEHDFLWRCVKALPGRGRIGIFNRSYYEEVLVTRVHPELLHAQGMPAEAEHESTVWKHRYEDINAFEHHLTRCGTRVVKVFLHVSKGEQRRRFLDRLDDPSKQWKFSLADIRERSYFDAYQAAYEDALSATSTSWAPWYVVPADHKPAMRALVGGVLVHLIDQLDLRPPTIDAASAAELDQARRELLAEPD
jgi:PPK2 family polyphosphate:nucleotide phosphotransferase